MGRRTTPEALIQNTVWAVEDAAHRVAVAPDTKEARRRLRMLRERVDRLEQRVMHALELRALAIAHGE